MHKFIRSFLDHERTWLRLLGIGLLLRLVLLAFMANEPLVSDGYYYHQAALDLLDHGKIDIYWPPGLPLYEAVVAWIFGPSEFWARVAMLPWFLVLARSLYHLLYRLHSRPAANIGLALLVFYPDLIHQSVEPLSYLPAAALLLSVFGRMQAYVDERRSRSLWQMGIRVGLLALFRPAALLFVIALPPLILLRRRKFIPGFVMVLGAALVVVPWIWVASRQADFVVPINTANARNFYLGNNAWTPTYKTWEFGSHWSGDATVPAGFRKELAALDGLPAQERARGYWRAALAAARLQPLAAAQRTAARMRTLAAFDTLAGARLRWAHHPLAPLGYGVLGLEALYWVLLGTGFLAFYFSESRRELSAGTVAIIGGFLLIYALPYWISFSHPSYHLPIVPLLIVPAAIWLQHQRVLGHWPRFPKGRGWKFALVIALFLGLQVEWVVQMLLFP